MNDYGPHIIWRLCALSKKKKKRHSDIVCPLCKLKSMEIPNAPIVDREREFTYGLNFDDIRPSEYKTVFGLFLDKHHTQHIIDILAGQDPTSHYHVPIRFILSIIYLFI